VPLGGIERARQERAEDGRLHLRPFGFRRALQQIDLRARQGQRGGVLEQLAVDARQGVAQDHREAAAIHLAPQRGDHGLELLRRIGHAVE